MYRFVKDSSPSASPKRLFMQGTVPDNPANPKMGPPIVTHFNHSNDRDNRDNLQAVYTRKKLSTELLGSSFESTKTSRCGEDGKRRITTKIVRKVTTLTRGEEQSKAEDLTKRAGFKSIEAAPGVVETRNEVAAKRVKV